MAGASDIEWTEATWNPIAGCTAVSPGCANCYAQRMAARLQSMGLGKYRGTTRKSGKRHVWTGRVNCDVDALSAPLHWRRSLRIFVNSMSDLFQDAVPEELVAAIWRTMQDAHWHTFQVLTKRPERMLEVLSQPGFERLPNVWLRTSVESADYLDRIGVLRSVPASVRFVSFEPLLGPVTPVNLQGIHWAIVGGESGPRARPMAKEWVEAVRVACKRQGVAFFFKQWGGTRKKVSGRLLDGRTWDEYPKMTTQRRQSDLTSVSSEPRQQANR
jgi:protein gp37